MPFLFTNHKTKTHEWYDRVNDDYTKMHGIRKCLFPWWQMAFVPGIRMIKRCKSPLSRAHFHCRKRPISLLCPSCQFGQIATLTIAPNYHETKLAAKPLSNVEHRAGHTQSVRSCVRRQRCSEYGAGAEWKTRLLIWSRQYKWLRGSSRLHAMETCVF